MQLMRAKSNSVQSTFAHEIDERAVPGRRPKLLFLAYHFPPSQAVGSVRAWNMAKYLARLGWEVTVITPDPSLCRSVNDPIGTEANLKSRSTFELPEPFCPEIADAGIAGLNNCNTVGSHLTVSLVVVREFQGFSMVPEHYEFGISRRNRK